MATIAEVKKQLKELLVIAQERDDLITERLCMDFPLSREDLIEEKEEELRYHTTNKDYGIYDEEVHNMKEPEMPDVPGKPEKKFTPLPFSYKWAWMIRSVILVLMTVLLVVFIKTLNETALYIWCGYVVFGLMGHILPFDSDNYAFKGLFIGFYHIIMLYRFPKYLKQKAEDNNYNRTVYVELLKDYEERYNRATNEYEIKLTDYNEKLRAYDQKREDAIQEHLDEFKRNINSVMEAQQAEYERKLDENHLKIKACEERMQPYANMDDSISFNPVKYSAKDISAIIDIIECGRASTLKEAFDKYYYDEIDRKIELQRQEEAQEQLRILQEESDTRLEEQRRHNREMEYNEQESQRIYRESVRIEGEKAKAMAGQAQSAARVACQTCIYRSNCHHLITGDPPINCSSYRGVRK